MNDPLLYLHPTAITPFRSLEQDLKAQALPFRAYQGARSPQDQESAKHRGVSKVGAWHSVHQYGFAADFAVYRNGALVWPSADDAIWMELRKRAIRFGLTAPISWDPGHIVLDHWRDTLTLWLYHTEFT